MRCLRQKGIPADGTALGMLLLIHTFASLRLPLVVQNARHAFCGGSHIARASVTAHTLSRSVTRVALRHAHSSRCFSGLFAAHARQSPSISSRIAPRRSQIEPLNPSR